MQVNVYSRPVATQHGPTYATYPLDPTNQTRQGTIPSPCSISSPGHDLGQVTTCARPRPWSGHDLGQVATCTRPRPAPGHGLHQVTACTRSRPAPGHDLHQATTWTSPRPAAGQSCLRVHDKTRTYQSLCQQTYLITGNHICWMTHIDTISHSR